MPYTYKIAKTTTVHRRYRQDRQTDRQTTDRQHRANRFTNVAQKPLSREDPFRALLNEGNERRQVGPHYRCSRPVNKAVILYTVNTRCREQRPAIVSDVILFSTCITPAIALVSNTAREYGPCSRVSKMTSVFTGRIQGA